VVSNSDRKRTKEYDIWILYAKVRKDQSFVGKDFENQFFHIGNSDFGDAYKDR